MLNSLKERLLFFINQKFSANQLLNIGDQIKFLGEITNILGISEEYPFANNLSKIFDVRSSKWLNLQFGGDFNTVSLVIEWSNDKVRWVNINSTPTPYSLTKTDGLVVEIKGYAYIKLTFSALDPSTSSATVKIRYT